MKVMVRIGRSSAVLRIADNHHYVSYAGHPVPFFPPAVKKIDLDYFDEA